MPELPEVQALAERLHDSLAGATLLRVQPLAFSALKTVIPPPEGLQGQRLDEVGRRGKFLVLRFESLTMLIHLSQGGRIDLVPGSRDTRPKGGVLRLRFDRDPAILVKEFGTERKAGWWVLEPGDAGPLVKLGPDPFSDGFAELIQKGTDGGRIHALLRDQREVAGIGRGYADDILHRAMLSPYRSLSSLDEKERSRLLESVRAVLTEALAMERRRTGGLPPKLGDHFTVHAKHGMPCPRCGEDLRRVSYQSHEVTYCPRCQTGGKILADRRLSRLLK
jgi:formamidopyrimidine-DNA glycosylase